MSFFENCKLIDLTHAIDGTIPTWSGECGFRAHILIDYDDEARVMEYSVLGSAGTHVDAPSHFVPGGRNIDQLTLNELLAPICVIDMSETLHANAQITLKDIELFESREGEIKRGSVVIGHTGWDRYWGTPKKYRGNKEYPEAPTFAADVGALLMDRGVVGIGIDTFSPDPYGGDYPLHQIFLGGDKYILENLTNLDKLPKKGSYLLALPMKIVNGTESPVRAIAFLPNELMIP